MADARTTLLQKYVSDMASLESHIFQAIDKQAKWSYEDATIGPKFVSFAEASKLRRQRLETRLEQLGGAANSPIKEGVAAVLGVAAGVIDQFRSDEISKNFRDDYTALNLAFISYLMLHTTANSVNDQQTAEIAAAHAKELAEFVNYIQKVIPGVVVWELKKNNELALNNSAVQQTQQLIDQVWS